MAETPDRPRRTGQFALDIIIALSAVIVSVASLWVALRANQTQEQLLKASVWPYVQFDSSNATETGAPQLVFEVRNEGVGPALVRSIAVSYNGRYYPTFKTLMIACCKLAHVRDIFSSTMQNAVIVAHGVVPFIDMPPNNFDLTEFNRIRAQRSKIQIQMCYCSVLGDCWFFDTLRGPPQPTPVRKCPPAQQPQYTT
jgi:hypothetical protein